MPAICSVELWVFRHSHLIRKYFVLQTITLSDDVHEHRVKTPLSTAGMFARAVPQAMRKKQGVLSVSQPTRHRVLHDGVKLEADRIEAFRQCCAFEGQRGGVPLSFPELYFTPLMAQAIVSREFPVSPLGLIHMRQTATQHQRLVPDGRYDARCELVEMRETPKGIEIDFEMELVNAGTAHWTGLGTMLSRAKSVRGGKKKKSQGTREESSCPVIDVEVAGDTGRKFARVTGDYNPHHLWSWTARPLGYRRPIAHGMWTLGRSLAVALARTDADASVSADASLKLPLYMPGTARFAACELSADQTSTSLEAFDGTTGAPYLLGQATLELS